MTTPLVISIATPVGSPSVSVTLLGNAGYSRSGGTSASASSGSGGWQVVDRSRRKAATEWLDYYPLVMTCDCLIDGETILRGPGQLGGVQSIEPQIAILESFEFPGPGSQPPLPPILTVAGPVAHTDLFWVCSRLAMNGGEDGAIRNAAGERTQQLFSIELTEYSPSTAITSATLSPAQQAALNVGSAAGLATIVPTTTAYTVKAGDTLENIAGRILGNVNLWTQIALLNGLSNSALLTPGQSILLPAAS